MKNPLQLMHFLLLREILKLPLISYSTKILLTNRYYRRTVADTVCPTNPSKLYLILHHKLKYFNHDCFTQRVSTCVGNTKYLIPRFHCTVSTKNRPRKNSDHKLAEKMITCAAFDMRNLCLAIVLNIFSIYSQKNYLIRDIDAYWHYHQSMLFAYVPLNFSKSNYTIQAIIFHHGLWSIVFMPEFHCSI